MPGNKKSIVDFDWENVDFDSDDDSTIKSIKKRMEELSDTGRFSESVGSYDHLFDDEHFGIKDEISIKNQLNAKRQQEKEAKLANKIIFNNPLDSVETKPTTTKKEIESEEPVVKQEATTVAVNTTTKATSHKKPIIEKQPVVVDNTKTINTNKSKVKIDDEFSTENLSLKTQLKLNLETHDYFEKNDISIAKTRQIIESLLYVMGKDGLELSIIEKITNVPQNVLKYLLDKMIDQKQEDETSGLIIKQYGNKYYLLCRQEMIDAVSVIWKKTIKKIPNKPKMQVLSIIAYNSPCTKKAIESVRGKDCTNILKALFEDGLIDKTKKPSKGTHAFFYTVTQEFLNLFNLKSLKDLPNLNKKTNKYIENYDFTEDSSDDE